MRDRAQHRGLDLVRAAQRARLDHLAREPLALERGGEQRLERGRTRLARACRAARGTSSVPSRAVAVASGIAAERSSSPTASSTSRHEARPNACAIRCAAGASAPERSGAPSRTRASSAARSASRPRCSASCARCRAASARLEAAAATTRNTTSATQFSASAIVRRPVGGMWKKLNATALTRLVAMPSGAPQTIETSSTPSRYTTPSDTGAATSLSGNRISVSTVTSAQRGEHAHREREPARRERPVAHPLSVDLRLGSGPLRCTAVAVVYARRVERATQRA